MTSSRSIDQAIQNICESIDENIARLFSEPELLSQNIVAQLRNLAEHIAVKIYSNGQGVTVDHHVIKQSIKHIKSNGQLKWLRSFHNCTQASVSHYSPDGENAYRLMLKYYESLLKIKSFLKDDYQLEVFHQLDQFPINQDSDLQQYYEKIAEKINATNTNLQPCEYKDRYYILSTKPFFVSGEIYYQVSFTTAHSNVSKFDRIIAFTKRDIPGNYAVKFNIGKGEIEVFDKLKLKMPVQIINSYEISIRPCEIDNFAKIFDMNTKGKGEPERYRLMQYLTSSGFNLVDLIDMPEDDYQKIRKQILKNYAPVVFPVLDKCRCLVSNKCPGSNLIRYLLFTMNNKIIQDQYNETPCNKLSELSLQYGCIPFDEMPFCTSLKGHNPGVSDLFECLNSEQKEHEHLARIIKNNTEMNGKLYTPETELREFDDLDQLANDYNDRLYYTHRPKRELKKECEHVYLCEYEENARQIIQTLKESIKTGVQNYENSVDAYLSKNPALIDCEEKKQMLKKAFARSKVVAIYGAAGTGKTKFIEHLANFFQGNKQHFLANTHSAVNNLKRRISVSDSSFYTIEAYKNNRYVQSDLLFIDECSTISNADMKAVLDKASFNSLVLVGDIFQIESIRFGNWFSFVKRALPDHCIFQLTAPYRTKDQNLLHLWEKVREGDDAIAEHIAHHGYASDLTEQFFHSSSNGEEIILCLNYGGLYGINNINNFMQANNSNQPIEWGAKTYKVDDPVLFNESNIFSPLIHNNCKGKINKIDVERDKIIFDIALEEIAINELNARGYNFELLPSSNSSHSIIRFSVGKQSNTDEDDNTWIKQFPFHVAYAVSIHKAQGLEYDSVKVVISDDTEEQISHNIFYTAITRSKNKLKIYWTAETQSKILSRIKPLDYRKDWHLLSQKIQEPINTE